jgi:hypothetical protein
MKRPSQRETAPRLGLCGALLATLVLIATGGFGCRTIYHESQAAYSGDARVRLELRLAEAQRARETAYRAALRLCEKFGQGFDSPAIDPDLDRLETAAGDFRRRIAAVADAASEAGPESSLSPERSGLEQLSTQLLEAVAQVRQRGAAGLADLERLLPELRDASRRAGN